MGETVTAKGLTRRAWERRPASRRADLLDAAERLFAERGLDATTVADVAAAAGVSKGSFYVYFSSKDALLEALNERLGSALFAVLDDVLATLVDGGATSTLDDGPPFGIEEVVRLLEAGVERMVRTLVARRDLIQVWSRERAAVGGSAKWLTRFVDRITPFLGTDGEAHSLPCSNPTLTSLLVVHGIFGTVLHTVLVGDDIDAGGLVRSAQEMAVRAFGLDRGHLEGR